MNNTTKVTSSLMMIFTIAVLFNPTNAIAVTQTPENISTEIIPINGEINLEVTTVPMYIPEENTLPWGAVKGTVQDPAERYPVIIQFFDANGESEGLDMNDLVHVAQVDVKGDNSYEYKFRVLNVDKETGNTIDIFEGEYIVKIFKVVNSDLQTI